MKSTSKQIKLLGLMIILILSFLFAFNVTYAYFSASHRVTGNIYFADLNVRFAYSASGSITVLDEGETTLSIRPATNAPISRGSSFNLALADGTAITYLAFNSSPDSCASYIRYRIDAYVVENGVEDTSVNYGQYFEFSGTGSNIDTEREVKTVAGVTNAIYFIQTTVNSGTRTFASSITLLDTAPIDILNSQIKLTITFEAVQAANQAYLSVFNDGWGYSDSWT